MDAVAALIAAGAILLGALALAPAGSKLSTTASWFDRLVAHHERRLRAARLTVDARRFAAVSIFAPPCLALAGLIIGSPVVAIGGLLGGFFMPRLYLDSLVRGQQRRTEAEAPRLLQVILASLAAGRTYLEALEEARGRIHDRWLRSDLDHIVRQFHLDIPLETSVTEVRLLAAGRNLGLIWDNLAICIGNRIPAGKAKGLFAELSTTVQFNVQVQQEVKARTSGQRAQIWLLAAIVPGLFFYLRLINPEFFAVLDETTVGRLVLFPAAVALEILGLVLSVRVARVDA